MIYGLSVFTTLLCICIILHIKYLATALPQKSIISVLTKSIFKGTNRKLPFFICRLNSEWLWFVHSSMHLGAAIARNWSQCGMKLVKRWEVLGLQ